MPNAVPPPRYESTISPETRNFAGPRAPATLGVRDQTGLELAFGGNPSDPPDATGAFITNEQQQNALTRARAVMDQTADDGANPMFPQYRRNFQPAGSQATEPLYTNVRDKNLTADEINAAKLGTPYTPTIASPGDGHGIDPNALRSVAATPTAVLQAGAVPLDNPSNAAHQNTDSTNSVTNIGTVRRFTLGVGSGATNGSSPETARGEFPRPPT